MVDKLPKLLKTTYNSSDNRSAVFFVLSVHLLADFNFLKGGGGLMLLNCMVP